MKKTNAKLSVGLLLLSVTLVVSASFAQRKLPPEGGDSYARPGESAEGVVEGEGTGEGLSLNTHTDPCNKKRIVVFHRPYTKRVLRKECGKDFAHIVQGAN